MSFDDITICSGKASPLGATLSEEGVNFAIFSRHATAVTLILFESDAQDSPYREIPLDKRENKTGDIWHCMIKGLKAGTCYLYRADGIYQPEQGLRYNPHKALIDPYAKALTRFDKWDFKKCTGFDPSSPAKDLAFSKQENFTVCPPVHRNR